MEQLIKEVFAKAQTVVGTSALAGGASAAIAVNGRGITFCDISGNIWINPNGTAVADVTSFPLVEGEAIDLLVRASLSIITDGSGATYKYIIWDV